MCLEDCRVDCTRHDRGTWANAPLNVSGTETVFGASPVAQEVIEAIAGILPHSVDMAELQGVASGVIAEATGAEAGLVTGCTSASIVISAAACMTGLDLGRIESLPDTTGMKDEIAIQKGHVVNYGSTIIRRPPAHRREGGRVRRRDRDGVVSAGGGPNAREPPPRSMSFHITPLPDRHDPACRCSSKSAMRATSP